MMMPFKRQALVEFDSVESAERCVSSGNREVVRVADQQAFFNFSTSQRITRPTNADDPAGGNKVLLLSIQNPLYPITTVSPAEPLPPLGQNPQGTPQQRNQLFSSLSPSLSLRTSCTPSVTPSATSSESSSSSATASRPWWNILTACSSTSSVLCI